MNKILELIKSLGTRWKSLSNTKKVSFILLLTGIILSIIFLSAYIEKASYDTLYTNLEPGDSAKVIEKLKSENIKYKVEGDTILVPKEMAAELRMSVALDMQTLNKGFEIFDQSKFGVTDTEAKIMYQRALEGELARTIESLDEVDKARVHLVMPDESVFAKETEEATASVIIKPKGLSKLNVEQVRAIIAMVSGSVKNLPQKNVQVLDTYANLLSDNIFDEFSSDGTVSANKQQEFEKQFEDRLKSDVTEMLEAVFGEGNISVKVNSDLNFDSKKITTIKYDKDNVVERSKRKITERAADSTGASGSTGTDPQFDNTDYTFEDQENAGSSSERTDELVNNEIGQVEESTLKAPGEVTRMSVSVLIDGNLNDTEKSEIRNIVASAVGFDETRGDTINISALPFNTDKQDKIAKELADMEAKAEKDRKIKLYTSIGAGAGALILFIILASILKKKKKPAEQNQNIGQGINVVVGDNIIPKQSIAYEPVLIDEEVDMTLEKELQTYASKKPDQVVEVIRTWLSEEESR